MTTYQSQSTLIRQRFSTLAAVTASNPVLLEGEKWNEKDATTGRATGRTKTGDGVVSGTAPNQTIVGTTFNNLPFDPAPGGGVSSVTLTPPAGWGSSSSNAGGSIVLTLGLPAGFSLPSNASQTTWDMAYTERLRWDGGSTGLNAATGRASLALGSAAQSAISDFATATQGAKADTAVQPAALTSKADLVGGLVPSAQLPGFVDDVLEFANVAAFPATGEAGKLYLSLATNRAYRWSGSIYVEINPSPGSTDAVPEGSVNLYFTTARAIGAALTGFTAAAGTVAATDSIIAAFQKVVGNIALRAVAGAIGSSGLTMNANRLLGRSTAGTGAPEELAMLGLAFNGTNLATLSDIVIPLSVAGTTVALTASTTVAKETVPYWPRATTLTDPWIWAVELAPTGAALQFDIQVNGTSIYLPASGGTYPTIAAGSTNSTSSAGAFTTAFAAAPTIPLGSSVSFFVRQVGGIVAGAGLKVAAYTRRAG